MNKDEALKLALETLECWQRNEDCNEPMSKILEAIKEALAQPEPVAWEQFYPDMGKPKLAYLPPTELSENACYIPPQRTWVGLTEREQGAIMEDLNAYGTNLYQFAQAIEAKLKEKNS